MTESRRPVDELHETKDDLQLPGRFGDYLRFAQGPLLEAFRHADEAALRAQKMYRRVTASAAALGTLAILASTAHLIDPEPPVWTTAAELICAVASGLAVLWGIVAGWHERWLVHRYQAEQYRLLKFDFLTDPALWTQPPDVWQPELEHRIQKIGRIRKPNLEQQADEEELVKIVPRELNEAIYDRERAAIFRYYVRRRLEVQIQYFSRIGGRESVGPLGNSRLVPIVFFVSLALLAMHLVREIDFRLAAQGRSLFGRTTAGSSLKAPAAITGAHGGEVAARPRELPVFLLASLLVPALWAGFRTFRGANQFGRNRARSAAKGAALTEVAKRMEVAPPALDSLFQNIALAESVLAADQGEWLRLMIEAEWYG
ncbi:MAG: hypothetical protein M3167_08315 [Acidobacteriota bacterium]|nr:hypothetical protein [Acidobacteriota bacterium]